MSCENNAGRDAVLQMGIASTWGTKAAATKRIPFGSESLVYNENVGDPEVFTGAVFGSRMDIMSEHVSGGFEMVMTPDEVAFFLYLALGIEYKVIPGSVGSTYKHYFVPVKSGGGMCLPMATIEVDRLIETVIYDTVKMNSLEISAEKESYLRATADFVGHDELDDQSLTAGLSESTKNYFKFRRASIYGDKLDSDYTVSGTGTGVEDETCATVPLTLTGAEGFEIQIPVIRPDGSRAVYEYVGSDISRTGTTLTFKDSPSAEDEIASVTTSAGIIDTANWNLVTEEYGDVESFNMSINNNLRTDRFTSAYKGKLSPINPQQREVTLGITANLNANVNHMRKQRFKTGRSLRLVMEFEVYDKIVGSTPYSFYLMFENAYITEIPINIDSADEVQVEISLTAKDAIAKYAANGAGVEDDTITTPEATSVLRNGDYVSAADPDGFKRVYKYLGADVTASESTLTFKDTGAAGAQVDSIWKADDIFNDAFWEMADGLVAYTIDGNDDEWCYARS